MTRVPGKHAPASSRSFLISLGTAVGGAVAALVVVLGIALVLLSGSDSAKRPESNAVAVQTRVARTHVATPRASSGTTGASSTPSSSSEASPTPNTSRTTLRILNGTRRKGLAAQLATRAKDEGYPQAIVGSAPRAAKSTIYYRASARADALAFQQRFPELTEVAPAPSSFSNDVVLTVVIGADYPSSQDSASPSPSPSG
ncbi:MAG: hypothetical protein NVSMB57_02720 [Actinomycetota bacterium]